MVMTSYIASTEEGTSYFNEGKKGVPNCFVNVSSNIPGFSPIYCASLISMLAAKVGGDRRDAGVAPSHSYN
jgi:hypothetical protein